MQRCSYGQASLRTRKICITEDLEPTKVTIIDEEGDIRNVLVKLQNLINYEVNCKIKKL